MKDYINNIKFAFSRIAMKTYLIILLSLSVTTGCAALNANVYVPCKKDWLAIENSGASKVQRSGRAYAYNAGGNCKEQAIAYHDVVRQTSVESCVTCGILSQNSQPLTHCWNEVKCPEDGKWKLIDTSRNFTEFQDGWDVEQSPEYMPYIRFTGKVTVEDIRNERDYSWKSDKSLSYLAEHCEFQWYPIISELKCIF